MDSVQYSVSDPRAIPGTVQFYECKDMYYCHNCGIKDGTLHNVTLFGLNFYLCDHCYKEFQQNQQQHSCPALNPDWYK